MSLAVRQPWSRRWHDVARQDIENHLTRPLPDDFEETITENVLIRREEAVASRRGRRHP